MDEAVEGKPLDDEAVNATAVYRPGPVGSKPDHGVPQPKAAALRSEPQGHVTMSVPAGFRQEEVHAPFGAHEGDERDGAGAYEVAGGAAGDDVDTERRPRGHTLVRVDGAGVTGVRTLSPPRLPAASLSPPRLLRLPQDTAPHQPTRWGTTQMFCWWLSVSCGFQGCTVECRVVPAWPLGPDL